MAREPSDELAARISVVIDGELLVGPCPTLEQLAMLRQRGVTAVLSLQEPDEAPEPPAAGRLGLRWARVSVADGHAGGTMSVAQLGKAVNQISRWCEAGEIVYVHCYAGIGRAPAVCAAYVAVSKSLGLGQALAMVRRAHPGASPTSQQLLVLSLYLAQRRRSS